MRELHLAFPLTSRGNIFSDVACVFNLGEGKVGYNLYISRNFKYIKNEFFWFNSFEEIREFAKDTSNYGVPKYMIPEVKYYIDFCIHVAEAVMSETFYRDERRIIKRVSV